MTTRQTVLVLFGGQSSEHRISCLSASYVIDTIRGGGLYDVLAVGITEDGRWFLTDAKRSEIADQSWKNQENKRVYATADASGSGFFVEEDGRITPLKADVVFPVLHGKNGEDGTVQGLLDLAGIPYVGCGTLASAVAMDKDIARQVFATAGIPQVDYLSVRKFAYDKDKLEKDVTARIGYPCFVKPANAGSSIGVRKVKAPDALNDAVEAAFEHDRKVLVEAASDGREIEVSVLGFEGDVMVSIAGEILPAAEFYDYEAKYDNPSSELLIPAPLQDETYEEIADLAARAFTAVGGSGLCRADFFVEKDRVYLNEINTMPGFTSISMYPKLMEASGVSGSELVNRLIDIAFKAHEGVR